MANVYIGTARGKIGLGTDAITVGTASTATLDFELRIGNPDQQGNVPTRKDVIVAIDMIKEFVLGDQFTQGTTTAFPPL